MIKFLLILIAIFLVAVFGLGIVFKRFLNMFGLKNSRKPFNSSYNEPAQKTKTDVIYSKDDVVVLKGEAGKPNQSKENPND